MITEFDSLLGETAPRAAGKRRRRLPRLEGPRHSVRSLIRPIEELARGSDRLFTAHLGYSGPDGQVRVLPRFLFTGPGSGGDYFRIGLFAGIHGDEKAGPHAVARFLAQLHENPDLARGYEIFAYPVCNPSGFALGTRWSRSGRDLNREFWQGSDEPEVQILESQLLRLGFHGLIALHSDDTSRGMYGFVKGHSLAREVLEPALRCAEAVLPRDCRHTIDNFEAAAGIIERGYPGILSAPPKQRPRPFEIVFETPDQVPLDRQVAACCVALQEMLDRFLAMMAQAQNI